MSNKNNPHQIFRLHNVGRNDPCPCGSGKKLKKCCGLAVRAFAFIESKNLLAWLKENDPQPPIDYNTVTIDELRDPNTVTVLKDRQKEITEPPPVIPPTVIPPTPLPTGPAPKWPQKSVLPLAYLTLLGKGRH